MFNKSFKYNLNRREKNSLIKKHPGQIQKLNRSSEKKRARRRRDYVPKDVRTIQKRGFFEEDIIADGSKNVLKQLQIV